MRISCVAFLALLARSGDGQEIHRVSPKSDPGVCTVDQWKRDWPGCRYEDGVSEGHLSVVRTGGGKAYRVDYAVGEIGPEKGGIGWRYPIRESEAAELTYRLTFSRDFRWVKGGKLPGLCGGPDSVTGGNPADGRNGFSARLMWRADGRGEAYVYHMNQPKKYGESFPFPADFRFPAGEPLLVRIRVSMNTPGRRDGRLDVRVGTARSGELRHVVRRSDVEWRATRDVAVDGVLFQTFYGGSDGKWAPRESSFTTFSDISTRSFDRLRDRADNAPDFRPRRADARPSGQVAYRSRQRGGGDRDLFSERAVRARIDAIHLNPVRRGLCGRPAEWRRFGAADHAARDRGTTRRGGPLRVMFAGG